MKKPIHLAQLTLGERAIIEKAMRHIPNFDNPDLLVPACPAPTIVKLFTELECRNFATKKDVEK